jgi:hypothetical protein
MQSEEIVSSENPSETEASPASRLSPALSRGAGTPSICRKMLRQTTTTNPMPSRPA